MNSKFSLIGININTMTVDTISTVTIANSDYIRGLGELCIVILKSKANKLWGERISLQELVKLNKLNKRENCKPFEEFHGGCAGNPNCDIMPEMCVHQNSECKPEQFGCK